MKKPFTALLLFLFCTLHAQIKGNLYELGNMEHLLTQDVKEIINSNIIKRPTVFLGEAVHYSGSDFLAKAEFVKFLVREHGYKDIAFESDFFALLFDHRKNNLFKMWASSDQCSSLMAFLAEHNVTIWGFDNQMHAHYSAKNFTTKLGSFLKSREIAIDEKFLALSDTLVKKGYGSRKALSKADVDYLKHTISDLLKNEKIKSDALWTQILESYSTSVTLYTLNDPHDKKTIPIRDAQMAKNLDFLIKSNPDKKFIVWTANGHMSKCDYEYMKGQTMGAQFRKLNPNTSYHIAFGSIQMPPERTEKSILKAIKDANSILYCLPDVGHNYYLDAEKIANDFPSYADRRFNDVWLFNLRQKKAQLLHHFDALVFIAGGIEVTYGK